MRIPDMKRVREQSLSIVSVSLKGDYLEIEAQQRLIAGANKADIVERATTYSADGHGPVAVAIGVVNIFNPMAWIMAPLDEGVTPITLTQQSANAEVTRVTMRFLRPAGADGVDARDFSGPAAGQGILVSADTSDFIADFDYSLDDHGHISIPTHQLAMELQQMGYTQSSGPVELTITASSMQTTQPGHVRLTTSMLVAAP